MKWPCLPPPATIEQCQQLLLARFKSGHYILASADKQGYRTLCYYRQTFLFVAMGDEGTSLLRPSTDDHLLGHLWQKASGKIIMVDN
ncbi:hypothetical protein SAMN04488069_103107 [Hymenobacter psychrophilus]|uniref:Uncharacterized protein n=1 Tax=Hymenobacter psychrophilus TaxID=651662 RepID=A0A1H3EEE4_9BACT|nr:hypothetical protein SAMN04488069_103107 [Hymenobacter psychrophilus]